MNEIQQFYIDRLDVEEYLIQLNLALNQRKRTNLQNRLKKVQQRKEKEFYMTETTNKTTKLSSYKVFIYGEAKVETIMPKSGKNAGKEIDVFSARAFHRNYKILENGDMQQDSPTWMILKKYGSDAKQLAALVKEGMQLRVDGSLIEKPYKDKEGKDVIANELNADHISLDLSQKAVKGIVFEKEVKQDKSVENKNAEPER